MQARKVQKLDNLSGVLREDNNYVKISICGPKDQVRMAVRDAIYGLSIVGGIGAKYEHTSELLKMESKYNIFDDEDGQIDIRISKNEFDRLVLMFRYCNQIGLSDFLNNVTGSDLLTKAKQLAYQNQETLEIKAYIRPTKKTFLLVPMKKGQA